MEYYVAVDVGATRTRVALCTSSGILEKVVYDTPRVGDELTVANSIIDIIKARWLNLLEKVVAVGVASIGPLDISRGKVVNSPNNPIRTFELLRPIAERLKKPVYVANDCVAAAWGERIYGDASGVENHVYLTLSTGVGAGVVVDGHLLIGKMGNAHEVGHMVVDFNSDLRCGCGGYGHWEAFAGGANIPKVAEYIVARENVNSELAEAVVSGASVNAKTIFEYYRRGDPLASRVVELYVKATAAGIASIVNAYDPELVVIGGSVFLNNVDVLYSPIVSLVRLNVVTEMPVIKPTRLRDEAGLYGALAMVVKPPVELLKVQAPVIRGLIETS